MSIIPTPLPDPPPSFFPRFFFARSRETPSSANQNAFTVAGSPTPLVYGKDVHKQPVRIGMWLCCILSCWSTAVQGAYATIKMATEKARLRFAEETRESLCSASCRTHPLSSKSCLGLLSCFSLHAHRGKIARGGPVNAHSACV